MSNELSPAERARLREDIAAHLNDIAKMFTEEMKLTLIVRHPTKPTVHLMLTDDSFGELSQYISNRAFEALKEWK